MIEIIWELCYHLTVYPPENIYSFFHNCKMTKLCTSWSQFLIDYILNRNTCFSYPSIKKKSLISNILLTGFFKLFLIVGTCLPQLVRWFLEQFCLWEMFEQLMLQSAPTCQLLLGTGFNWISSVSCAAWTHDTTQGVQVNTKQPECIQTSINCVSVTLDKRLLKNPAPNEEYQTWPSWMTG